MLIRSLANFLGLRKPKGVVVFERNGTFYVRPAIIVVDDGEVRFRNFTDHRIEIGQADFLATPSFELASWKTSGDHKKVDLAKELKKPFYEYYVKVRVPNAPPVEAIGESRPGAIIDR